VYFDVDVMGQALGFWTSATLWLTVAPAHLASTGSALAAHREVPYAAAVTGRANLVVSVICHDIDELYDFVTTKVGALEGIQQVEVSPVLRRVKQAGALVAGDRFVAPAAPRRRRP
jgi:DNA-binding Lrp family transcriptional regulator